VVAIARELIGCMWAIAKEFPSHRQSKRPRPIPLNTQLRRLPNVHRQSRSPGCGVTLDGGQRPLGHTRAESEAGTRRRQGRWYPTHGYPQEQPSYSAGSDFSDAPREKNMMQT
jgi:hypothetical protein